MSRYGRWTAGFGAALTLLTATGCAPPISVVGCGTPADESVPPVPATDPTYTGPPPGAEPSATPPTTLLGEVALTATGGDEYAAAAVVRAQGGAYVAMTDAMAEESRLLTVAPVGDDFEVMGWVDLPSASVVDLLALPGDRVLMVGALTGDDRGYGVSVVDPATDSHIDTVLRPARDPDSAVEGSAVLSSDGRTLYVQIHSYYGEDDGTFDLVAVDLHTGDVVASRDLADDLTALAGFLPGTAVADLLARPAGGVTLAVSAVESQSCWENPTPALLRYDAALTPDGDSVVLAPARDGLRVSSISAGTDGTAFVLLERYGEEARVVAVPDRGTGTLLTTLRLDDDMYVGGLVVDPAQAWAVIPTLDGVRALDLGDAGVDGASLTLDCLEGFDGAASSSHSDANPGIYGVEPNEDASTLLLLGECDTGGLPPPTLWIVGS